tara:strand:- start:261 stop:512 length:252 start_codon:yes stop_codon:yes gene_type:complete
MDTQALDDIECCVEPTEMDPTMDEEHDSDDADHFPSIDEHDPGLEEPEELEPPTIEEPYENEDPSPKIIPTPVLDEEGDVDDY